MIQEERQLLIERQLEKSHRFLLQADEMIALEHADLAVNRYYYACYHIVQALFLQKQISVRTHCGIISQFSLYFVKTKIVSIEDGSLLARLFQLRQKADYNCAYDFSIDEAKDLKEPTHRFVESITEIICQESDISAGG